MSYQDELRGVVALGYAECSLNDFARRLKVCIEELMRNPHRDHALLNVLCEAGQIGWELSQRTSGRWCWSPRKIVCLCGSTRFWREFQRAGLRETLAGNIVLSIGAASGTDDEHFGNLSPEEYARVKLELDDLHLDKIALADEVLILNVGGYIGQSTRNELAHARRLGKTVRFLEPDKAPEDGKVQS